MLGITHPVLWGGVEYSPSLRRKTNPTTPEVENIKSVCAAVSLWLEKKVGIS
jgi:hypothetical protein